jgi:hypothetical protein
MHIQKFARYIQQDLKYMKQDLENYGFVDKAAFKNETQDLVDPRA